MATTVKLFFIFTSSFACDFLFYQIALKFVLIFLARKYYQKNFPGLRPHWKKTHTEKKRTIFANFKYRNLFKFGKCSRPDFSRQANIKFLNIEFYLSSSWIYHITTKKRERYSYLIQWPSKLFIFFSMIFIMQIFKNLFTFSFLGIFFLVFLMVIDRRLPFQSPLAI